MILNGVKLIGHDDVFSIRIDGARIASVSKQRHVKTNDSNQLSFENALAFPGLINSHDHLDFNLFSQLGDRTYTDYVEWGDHLHQHYKEQIRKVLNIPVALRAQWGLYKNLLCGVTSVVDHGVKHRLQNKLITVVNRCQNLHSVRLEKNWKFKLNNPLNWDLPVVIHTGEGINETAGKEINQLINLNFLRRNLIGVHGIAMSARQARHFKALVWCPETNYFLLNKTADIKELKQHTNILFGTDSTLTGNWNIWQHIRLAKANTSLKNEELYSSLTITPAKIWKLNSGQILPGKDADVVIAESTNGNNMLAFFDIRPQDILMVIHQGNIRLFDGRLLGRLKGIDINTFSKISVKGICKYVQGDLPGLMAAIKQYDPDTCFPIEGLHPETELAYL